MNESPANFTSIQKAKVSHQPLFLFYYFLFFYVNFDQKSSDPSSLSIFSPSEEEGIKKKSDFPKKIEFLSDDIFFSNRKMYYKYQSESQNFILHSRIFPTPGSDSDHALRMGSRIYLITKDSRPFI